VTVKNQEFTNIYVRDLAWVIKSPAIINSPTSLSDEFFTEEHQKFLPALNKLDSDPTELIEFLKKSKRKALGNYFEDLIEFWLAARKNTKILARNLQIIDEKKTIGECDFIAEFEGQTTHIEVAIKYYLGIRNSTDARFWVGRGLTDRLDIKLEKMFSHQLELSNNIAMQKILEQNNIVKIERKISIFKGYFFKYFFEDNHCFPLNTAAEIDEAYWCRIDEIDSLPSEYENWQILTKPHWLTNDDEWFKRKELAKRINQYFMEVKETPVLCNAMVGNKPAKFFIAPSRWTL
jgi:hypothetical protein